MINQRGALTLDFIFALVLVMSMTMLLGVFSFTLSIVEGVQYLAFSTSRAYFAADVDQASQKAAALKKFQDLSSQPAYKSFLRKDWFDLTLDDSSIGDFSSAYSANDPHDIFQGVRAKLTVGILNMAIPLFGATDGDQPNQTFITSFLGREPTSEECMSVIQNRYKQILKLNSSYGNTPNPEAYVPFDDNGC